MQQTGAFKFLEVVWQHILGIVGNVTHHFAVLGKLLFKSNLSMSTITWLEK